jgi:hypothetical protein
VIALAERACDDLLGRPPYTRARLTGAGGSRLPTSSSNAIAVAAMHHVHHEEGPTPVNLGQSGTLQTLWGRRKEAKVLISEVSQVTFAT